MTNKHTANTLCASDPTGVLDNKSRKSRRASSVFRGVSIVSAHHRLNSGYLPLMAAATISNSRAVTTVWHCTIFPSFV